MSIAKIKNAKYFDLWEEKKPEDKSKEIKNRLADYVEHARKLDFYQSRLEAFDPTSEHPLKNVPTLESTHLREHIPPAGEGLLTESTGFYNVFQSGGTTGMPKTSLFTTAELQGLDLPNSRGFYACGMREKDRVANLWAVGGLYMTFVHINQMLLQYGSMNFPFSNQTPADFIHTVAKHFKINVFTGITSVVLSNLRKIYELTDGKPDFKVDKIYFGGEHIYEADRIEMERTYGVKTVLAPGYGTVDSWYLGYQCEHTPPGVFHQHDDQSYIEIINEETKSHCGAEEVGMLYATAFPRRLTPIIRYRVGDRAQWMAKPCECGRTTPLFQLLGRGDDILRVGYDSIDYQAVQDLIVKIEGLSGVMQMQKTREDGKDVLTIRIETKVDASHYDELAKKLNQAILDDRPSFRDFISKGTIAPLRIELLKMGSIPVNSRTGKLIRVIDAL